MEINARPWPANLVDLLLDAVFLVDMEGRIVQVSAASERILGYSPAELIGRSMLDFVYAEDRARTIDEARLVMAGVPRIGFENRYVRKDGRLVHIMWSALLSATEHLRIGVARDVTEGKLAHARQSATYAISQAVQGSADLASMFDEAARIVAELIPVVGFSVFIADRAGAHQPSASAFSPSARRWAQAAADLPITRQAPGSEEPEFEIALPLLHGGRRHGVLLVSKRSAYSTEDAEFLGFIAAQIAAAIERKMLHDDLLRAARYDELTGLPNRRLFYDRLCAALARARRKGAKLALLYIDIDDFKVVNDSFGHAAGDAVLSQLAVRLRDCVRESDTVSRFGGDEFVVLMEDIKAAGAADAVAAKINASLKEKIEFNGSSAAVGGASIGIALFPRDGEDGNALLAHADREMYLVKRGRSKRSAGA